ncbi:MAG: methyltransferase [Pseudomonadota bacterium]
MVKQLFAAAACAAALGCAPSTDEEAAPADSAAETLDPSSQHLDEILSALPEDAIARIPYRNPKETLAFFGVEPGMTVVDTVPGDIWYTHILARYLGPDGTVIGADRPLSVWEWFGPDYSPPEFLEERKSWPTTWTAKQTEIHGTDGPAFEAFVFGSAPESLTGSVDVVMVIREMHNMIAADESSALVENMLAEVHAMLAPNGVFGIIQHRAQEDAPDSWANGANGYLKQSALVALVGANGFALEAASEINANPKDRPTDGEAVWRLPPALYGSEEDDALRDAMLAIGESDRMTLKFRKVE